MRPDPKEEASRWFRQAAYDLKAAGPLMEAGQHNLACFQCQQAAEKAVKALIYGQGALSVTGHSVKVLLEQIQERFPDLKDLIQTGARLDRLYLPTRYPNALPGGIPAEAYDESDSRETLEMARIILDRVKGLLDAKSV